MEVVTATRSGAARNWARDYGEVVDRHGPLLAASIGQTLTGVWTPTAGLVSRRSAPVWASRSPMVFVFGDVRLEFAWHTESRSVTYAETDPAGLAGDPGDPEGWCRLGGDPRDPAELVALTGRQLWAVDVFEHTDGLHDLGFAFGGGYLTMTSRCCCTLVLVRGPLSSRQLRLATATPTRDGYPPTAVPAPRGRPAWPPHGTDPSQVWTGRPGPRTHT